MTVEGDQVGLDEARAMNTETWNNRTRLRKLWEQALTWPGLMMIVSFGITGYVALTRGDVPTGLLLWSTGFAANFTARWLWSPNNPKAGAA